MIVDPQPVASFRSAARRILRDDSLNEGARTTALIRLSRRAKDAPDPELAAGAIVAELGWNIDRDDVNADRTFGEPLERRHRLLRGAGYQCCPECWSLLSSERDWAIWRQRRVTAIAEAEAREAAVL